MKSKRNGKIELLRFVFALAVLMFHIGKDLYPEGALREIGHGLTYFYHGRSGVEFFFLLSGFFCAAAVYKIRDKKSSIGMDTFQYVKGRIFQIMPYHIFANLGLIVIFAIYSRNFIDEFIKRFPSLFFLQKTGLSEVEFNGIEWYIPAMLFALCIIYPLLRKNFDMSAYVLAPVISTFMLGYFCKEYGRIPGVTKFSGVIYTCNLRAVAVMLFGVFCFVISMELKKLKLSKIQELCLIVIENVCWLGSLWFMISDVDRKFEFYNVYALAVAITICLSRDINSKVYNNKFVYYLGKLSLPLYLSQNIARHIFSYNFRDLRMLPYTVLTFLLAIVIGVICKEVSDCCQKAIKKHSKVSAGES